MKKTLFFRVMAAALMLTMLVSFANIPIAAQTVQPDPGTVSEIIGSVETQERTLAEEAALRLYLLGLLEADGEDESGMPVFELNTTITRIEAVYMIAKFLSLDDTIAVYEPSGVFTDVSEEDARYAEYATALGYFGTPSVSTFCPDEEINCQQFLSVIVSVLGYEAAVNGPIRVSSAALAVSLGLIDFAPIEFLREHAVLILFNAVRQTVNGTDAPLSDSMIESGAIDELNAEICIDHDVSEVELLLVGSMALDDDYYDIISDADGMALRPNVRAMNTVKRGTALLLGEDNGSILQRFRTEMTERGTYYLYAAASETGYGRRLAIDEETGAVGLYRESESSLSEFYIVRDTQDTDSESWLIIPTGDTTAALTRADDGTITIAARADDASQRWCFEKAGYRDASGREKAIFPLSELTVSQGIYGSYSHQNKIAIDFTSYDPDNVAPFNAEVVAIYSTCNTVVIQSLNKVLYPDGTYDYMTAGFMHDNDIRDLAVGDLLLQGEVFYQTGTAGNVTGRHVHIYVYRGAFNKQTMPFTGGGDTTPQDAFFVPTSTTVRTTYNYGWVYTEE